MLGTNEAWVDTLPHTLRRSLCAGVVCMTFRTMLVGAVVLLAGSSRGWDSHFKVPMKWRIIAADLKGFSRWRGVAFPFLEYLFLF